VPDAGDVPEAERSRLPGERVVIVSWVTTVVFAVTAIGDRAGIDALELPATVVAVGFFLVGMVVWGIAFVRAVGRSRHDEITLSGLFFLQGTAPRPIQVQLLGSLAIAIVVAAATASEAPFGVMEPVLPLALAGWWGARYGEFGPRRTVDQRKRP